MVPTDLRLAVIGLKHRNGDPVDVFNYRPVRFISIICKIIESILKKALLSFLSAIRAITPYQHAFLSRRNVSPSEEEVTRMMDEATQLISST